VIRVGVHGAVTQGYCHPGGQLFRQQLVTAVKKWQRKKKEIRTYFADFEVVRCLRFTLSEGFHIF